MKKKIQILMAEGLPLAAFTSPKIAETKKKELASIVGDEELELVEVITNSTALLKEYIESWDDITEPLVSTKQVDREVKVDYNAETGITTVNYDVVEVEDTNIDPEVLAKYVEKSFENPEPEVEVGEPEKEVVVEKAPVAKKPKKKKPKKKNKGIIDPPPTTSGLKGVGKGNAKRTDPSKIIEDAELVADIQAADAEVDPMNLMTTSDVVDMLKNLEGNFTPEVLAHHGIDFVIENDTVVAFTYPENQEIKTHRFEIEVEEEDEYEEG